jgi:hypothetical protein
MNGATKKDSKNFGNFRQEWKDQQGIDLGTEDVVHFSVGHGVPMGIFFDLRPASELMNPILFDYNPADDWQKLAPVVWYALRTSFEAFLRGGLYVGPVCTRASGDARASRLLRADRSETPDAVVDVAREGRDA